MDTLTKVLLGLAALTAFAPGMMKVVMLSKMQDDPKMEWIQRVGVTKARVAGLAEVAAAAAFVGTAIGIGFLENGLLAGLAAVGMVVTMGMAIQVHKPHGEPFVPNIAIMAINLVLATVLLTTWLAGTS